MTASPNDDIRSPVSDPSDSDFVPSDTEPSKQLNQRRSKDAYFKKRETRAPDARPKKPSQEQKDLGARLLEQLLERVQAYISQFE